MEQDYNIYFLSIAGFSIQVIFRPSEFKHSENMFRDMFCKQYNPFLTKKSGGSCDYRVVMQGSGTLEAYMKRGKRGQEYYALTHVIDEPKKTAHVFYSASSVQFEVVLKWILFEKLLPGRGSVMHGSAVCLDGKAHVFIGSSGAGKSTIARMLSVYGRLLADDMFILRNINKNTFFFQMPFYDKYWQFGRTYEPVELQGFYSLKKSSVNMLSKNHSPQTSFTRLLSQAVTSRPIMKRKTISLIKTLSQRHTLRTIEFTLSQEDIPSLVKLLRNQ